MPIVTVPVTTSTRKKTIYNSNQRVNAKTIGNIPGLEDDLVLYPKSIAMIIRELFDVLPTDKQFFNGNIESFDTTEIVTKEGAYLVGDDIYYLEALTLAPTAAGFWGFFEIELEAIDSDPASLQFFDVSTNTVSQQVVNTRKSYNIKVYENYNTTASFPTLTPGRIKWIEFKKDAAFGNIIEVKKLLNSVVLPKDKSGTVALLEDQTFIGLNDTPVSYSGQNGKYPRVNSSEDGIEFAELPGLITGGLMFNNATTPPSLSSGFYGINGKLIEKPTDVALTLTDTIAQARQTFESFSQYLILMNSVGVVKYCLYGESQVASGTISSITGTGTTKTINFATGTLTSGSNKILVITGNNGVNGIFKIASNPTSSSATFESVSSVIGGSSGTWTVYERISTLHGVGSNTAITNNTDVLKYTPSYGENGWATGIVSFDHSKNGFYLNIPGLTEFRVIGNFRTNGSSQVISDLVSHKNGRNKNDNDFKIHTDNGLGGTNTTVQRFSTIAKAFGCDYVIINDNSANGASCEIKRSGYFSGSHTGGNNSTNAFLAISINANGYLSTTPISIPPEFLIGGLTHQTSAYHGSMFSTRAVYSGDILRPQTNARGNYNPAITSFDGSLIL